MAKSIIKSVRGFFENNTRRWRDSWKNDIGGFWPRFQAYLDMLFVDHGFFRFFYQNRIRVTDQVIRQSHPLPKSVASAARLGIKTVINLRGSTVNGSYLLSKDACERHGLRLINFKAFSRRAPEKEIIRGAKKMFEEVEYPIMMHCKSGADRAGIMSALYLLIHEQRPLHEAKQQLKWYYGHVRQTKTGILDFFLEAYEKDNQQQPIDFMTWVETRYNPQALTQSYKTTRWQNILDSLMNRE